MRLKSIIAPLLFSACALPFLLCASVAGAQDLQLQENPPDRYTVQKGDTLWGISGKFLKQPWRWPEIWQMNRDQIRNPHLIYPGDVIALDKVNGEWRLSLAQRNVGPRPEVRLSPSIRVDSLEGEAISSIPPGDLAPFLSLPLVTDAGGIPGAARIIAARDNRVVRGVGDFVYAINVDDKSGTQWYIYRPGKILHSFDSDETLGYEMRFLGTARVDRFGEVARMEITTAREERSAVAKVGCVDRANRQCTCIELIDVAALDARPESAGFNAEHHVAALPIISPLAPGDGARRVIVEREVGKARGAKRIVEIMIAEATAAVHADIEAGPVIRRRHDCRCL